jgi:hypothetical protein
MGARVNRRLSPLLVPLRWEGIFSHPLSCRGVKGVDNPKEGLALYDALATEADLDPIVSRCGIYVTAVTSALQ